MLRELVENVEEGRDVAIDDMSPAVFKALLRFVYGRERPNSDTLCWTMVENCSRLPTASVARNLSRTSSSMAASDPTLNFVLDNGRELLEAADGFGCKKFKSYVESEIVRDCITTENAASWIVFADCHSCGYLKEVAVEVFDSDPQAVMKSRGWDQLSDSNELLVELIGRLARRPGTFFLRSAWLYDEDAQYNSDDYYNMTVQGLRKLIEQRG
eukprot:CAMPEP_0194066924 /NCGR_PEP_ID=MMETSP0009_2-20130614/86286_1 /TAXON_ID=210454 /ORGANISM="Grammatophora oceanica, Strain CCMP 410" /LENGTH=212 /DNA_ID=CAMNT_0038719919 /DNA_START=1281 /DNA_END=1916 /DNA_ORIENTATION=+